MQALPTCTCAAHTFCDICRRPQVAALAAIVPAIVPAVINAVAPAAADVPAVALVAVAVPAIVAATLLIPPPPPPTPLAPIIIPAVAAAAAVVAAASDPGVVAAAAVAATAAALTATALALASSGSSESDGCEELDVARWLAEGAATLAAKAAPKGRHEKCKAASKKEAQARSAALSTTADTVGVSFRGRAFQQLYYETKYARRGQLVHDILERLLGDRSSDRARATRRLLRNELTAKRSGKARLTVCSVGGGPGTDAAGVVAANANFLGFLPAAAAAVSTAESALADIAASYRVARKAAADRRAASELAETRRAAHGRRAASRRKEMGAVEDASAAATAAANNDDGSATAKQREAAVKATGALERARESAAAADACSARSEVAADAARVAAADAAATAERVSKEALVCARAASAAAPPSAGETERARLHISLLDFEPQWGGYAPTLAALFRPRHATVDFSTCDVCAPLSGGAEWAANRAAAAPLYGADLLVFAYVCHETSRAAALSGHAFYRDLAVGARAGALLLFADVQSRSAAALAAVYAAMEEAVAVSERRIVRVPLGPAAELSLRSDLMLLHVVNDIYDVIHVIHVRFLLVISRRKQSHTYTCTTPAGRPSKLEDPHVSHLSPPVNHKRRYITSVRMTCFTPSRSSGDSWSRR